MTSIVRFPGLRVNQKRAGAPQAKCPAWGEHLPELPFEIDIPASERHKDVIADRYVIGQLLSQLAAYAQASMAEEDEAR